MVVDLQEIRAKWPPRSKVEEREEPTTMQDLLLYRCLVQQRIQKSRRTRA